MTTTSAPADRLSRVGRRVRGPDPRRRSGSLGQGLRPVRVAVHDRHVDAGQHVPEHLEVAPSLDARPDERRSRGVVGGPAVAAAIGPNRAIATPDTAAVRWAVIGPPSRIAMGSPVVRIAQHDHGVDGR